MSFVITHENVMDCLVMVANDEIEIKDIRFSDDFEIHIKINGERWNGSVNYYVAKYIVQLQKDIIKIHNSLFPSDKMSIKSLRKVDRQMLIDVKIHDGCTEIRAKLSQILDESISKIIDKVMERVTAKQILAGFITAAVLYAGSNIIINCTNRHYDAKETIERLKSEEVVQLEQIRLDKIREVNDANTRELLIGQIGASLELASKNAESFRYLRNALDPDDTITAARHGNTVSGDDLRLSGKDRPERSAVYVDGFYTITGIDIKYNRLTFLAENERAISASTEMLSDHEKSSIHDMLKSGDIEKVCPTIGLLVTAKTKGEDIESLSVVGLADTPRPGHVPYSELAGVKKVVQKKSAASLPLSKLMGVPDS
ncbi:hypothetical protein H4684_003414 [Desulfomicrobium macestii]|uniref:Uncharacterized protein n=1 Tax=Desulfomicrobium macestii TaxID=90731 RepID=A0ABR9H7T7_9BACT|nr:hypothetical protein [Desulfomicrobium macestii]MBE1426740.1 hypothetical protein [Desulfomicrobium macestii]